VLASAARTLVIVVSADDGRWLPACFDALSNSTDATFEVLLVANGCTDESEVVAAAHCTGPALRVVRTPARCGFAEANNIGIRLAIEAGHRYVLLLNPDTRVHPTAIATLEAVLEGNSAYGIVGSWQGEYDSPDWNTPNEWTTVTLRAARSRSTEGSNVRSPSVVDHEYVQGAAMMLRADLVARIGMLDPGYESFYEETDLCRRCLLAGFGVGIVMQSRVKHYGGGNWRRTSRGHRHRDLLFLRNQYVYFLSAYDGWPARMAAGLGILRDHLRTIVRHREHVQLPLWRYPQVLASVVVRIGMIGRLHRRNAAIQSGSPLDPSEYAIERS
jgi:GT2 family glycosyltransferase